MIIIRIVYKYLISTNINLNNLLDREIRQVMKIKLRRIMRVIPFNNAHLTVITYLNPEFNI